MSSVFMDSLSLVPFLLESLVGKPSPLTPLPGAALMKVRCPVDLLHIYRGLLEISCFTSNRYFCNLNRGGGIDVILFKMKLIRLKHWPDTSTIACNVETEKLIES